MTDPVRLREFETLERPAGAFSAQDVDALYHQFGSQIRIEWPTPATGGQWRLTPGGWVGIFPASKDLTVIVEPKVPLRSVFAMWEWAYDLSQFRVLDGAQPVTTFEEFYSQMARILAAQVLARGRKGLAREYVGFDEPLPVIRGRLDVPALIRRPWATQPVCHYHEHTPDIADNQILAWTLGGILHAPACNLAARPVVRQAFMMLRHAVDARPFAARDAAGRRYTRLTADYAPMHALCRFFIEHSGPSQQSLSLIHI